MATIDDLSVRVSADVGSFTANMNRAESSLSGIRNDAFQTASALQILQGRFDETGDEAQTAGAKAGASSSGFSALAASAASTKISFSSLSVVTTATLIPSLLTLATVVAPLAAALGGFITIAGSIAGIGLVGFLGAAATNGDRLKSTFNELTSTIREEFAPVFDVFAGVLDRLMQSLTSIIPELVPAQEVVKQIASQFEALGQAIIGVLPAFTEMAVQLTQRFLPPFVRWAEKVLPKIPGMLQSLIPIMLKVGQALAPLARSLLEIAPTMTRFGMTVLNVVAPALEAIVGALNGAMEAVNGMDKQTAALVATLTVLSPIIAKIGLVVAGLSTPILAVVAAVGALAVAFKTNFAGVRTTIQRFQTKLQAALGDNVPTLINNLKTIIGTILTVVEPVVSTIVKLFAGSLVNAIDLVVSALTIVTQVLTGDFSGAIETAQGFLGRFADRVKTLFSGIVSAVQGAIGTIKTAISEGFGIAVSAGKDALNGLIDWLKSGWDIAGSIADVFVGVGEAAAGAFEDAFNSIIPSSIGIDEKKIQGQTVFPGASIDLPQLDTGGFLESDGLYMGHQGERVLNPAETEQLQELKASGGGTQEVDVKVNFDVEGSGPLADFVEQNAETVIQKRERRTMRNSGRNLSPR